MLRMKNLSNISCENDSCLGLSNCLILKPIAPRRRIEALRIKWTKPLPHQIREMNYILQLPVPSNAKLSLGNRSILENAVNLLFFLSSFENLRQLILLIKASSRIIHDKKRNMARDAISHIEKIESRLSLSYEPTSDNINISTNSKKGFAY